MLLLTACAASPPVVRTKTEYVYPPAALIQPTPAPYYTGKTWGDVAEHCVRVESALDQCNADKKTLREWKSSGKTLREKKSKGTPEP
ncbi:Rz1-like lysis system protein LysC [Marinobacter aromaticivorans]